jgi:hypothetical protein
MSRYYLTPDYTGAWCQSVRAPDVQTGDKVRIAERPDAREYGDFIRSLEAKGLTLEFRRYYPRLKLDEFVVIEGSAAHGFKGV